MKAKLLTISLIIFSFCNHKQESLNMKEVNNSFVLINKIGGYDSIKYDKIINIDTTGCWRHKFNNKLKDSLINEKAVVKVEYGNIFFKTAKYERLWVCKSNFPAWLFNYNDTLLISANVYSIGGAESMPGQPAILQKLIYQDNKKK